MKLQASTMILYILVGCALGALLVVFVLPGWLPALAASITGETVYWLLARVGGFIAYGLLWLSVVFGLLLTSKVARLWPGVRHANTFHQSVSLLALGYTFFHALILLADHMSGFDMGKVLFPFTSTYRPLAVGLGQLGFYVLVIVTLSYYVRKRIGMKTWRVLHYLTFILYYLVTAHGVLAGTDSRAPWALVLYASTGLITYALTLYRVLAGVKPVSKEKHELASYPTTSHNPVG